MGVLLDGLYLAALSLASPFLAYKALTRPRHIRGLSARLGLELPAPSNQSPIWVHGVSVGEILAAKTFIGALGRAFPGRETVISTTTSTGQEIARKTYPGHRVFYFPIDLSWSVRRVFETIKPALIILVELELWPNFLERAARMKVPVAVVNGRITERSARRYKLAPGFIRAMFRRVARTCAQTESYAERFRALGVPSDRILVTGSMKYDNLGAPVQIDAQALRASLGIARTALVLIGGSTHASEESALLAAFVELRREHPGLRLILAPRHNERTAEVERESLALGVPCVRFSLLPALAPSDATAPAPAPVILVDVMGELGRLYACADLCFVGGSLIPHGGQNILEPASLGKAVVFGPHTFNFQESVTDLIAAQGALQVADEAALRAALRDLLRDPDRAAELGRRARAVIELRRGATDKTIAALAELLERTNPAATARP